RRSVRWQSSWRYPVRRPRRAPGEGGCRGACWSPEWMGSRLDAACERAVSRIGVARAPRDGRRSTAGYPCPMLHLASQSPRRRELLARLGVDFGIVDVDVPEVRVPGEPPEDYVHRVAREKAGAGLLEV